MTEITHLTRSIRVAPRKMRLVIDKLRHVKAETALATLPLVNKAAAKHVAKSVKAAIFAAKDANLDPQTLVIQRIFVDEGTALKRTVRFSRGRSAGMMKKFSHLSIVLHGEPMAKPSKRSAKKSDDAPAVTEEVTQTQESNAESAN